MLQSRKRRSFTAELLFWMVLLVVLPVVVFSVYFFRHMTTDLKEIEKEKSLLANQAAERSIQKLGETILGVTITNGYWEENRQAVLRRDMDWLNKNIRDSMPGVVPNVDFVAETDLAGNVLVQAGHVEELTGKLRYAEILSRFQKETEFSGIVNTSKGAAVIAVSQVTDDQGVAKAVGLLITGRLLTDEILQELQDTLQTDIALVLQSGQALTSSDELREMAAEQDRSHNTGESFRLLKREGDYVSVTTAPFEDLAGQPIGTIVTEVPAGSMTRSLNGLGTVGSYSLAALVFLFVLVFYLMRQRILLPLRHFTATLEEVAAGHAVETIPRHVMQAEAEILNAISRIMEWNQTLEQTVLQRTAAIRNLLDNARQGFLAFGADFTVRSEYSEECTRLFGREIAGAPFPDLIYPHDEEERHLAESILTNGFRERNEMKRDVVLSLLPEILDVNGVPVQAEYRYIAGRDDRSDDTIMVILTDISEKKELERRVERERDVLNMIVQVVTHRDEFADMLGAFEHFYGIERPETLQAQHIDEQHIRRLFRMVHTLKGNFALLRMIHIVPQLHVLESDFADMLQGKRPVSRESAERSFADAKLLEALEQDKELLVGALGRDWLREDGEPVVTIPHSAWLGLEQRLANRLRDEEDRPLLAELRRWRYQPIETLLSSYPDYLLHLAERCGVSLHPVVIQGGELRVDVEYYRVFAKSLIHLVRNSVVHGIEPQDERLEAGKDECGTVTLAVRRSGGELCVTVTDDGRGVSLEALRRKAADTGRTVVHGLSEGKELEQLLFMNELSTAGEETEAAGRGVGLSAVKAEVERLDGRIEVRTEAGSGTTFTCILPFRGSEEE